MKYRDNKKSNSYQDERSFEKGMPKLVPRDAFISKSTVNVARYDTKVPVPPIIKQKSKKTNAKDLLEIILSGLKKMNNMVDVDGPAKENWEFCIFEVKKK